MPKRCALGCPQRGVPSHVFPNPKKIPEAFKAWVELIGGKLNTASDYEFYRKKIICDIHFTPNDKNKNNRLNCLAVPSLFLPNKPVTSAEVETDITSSSAIVDVCQPSSSIAIPLESAEEDMINVAPRTIDLDIAPATSSGSVDDPFLEHNYFKRELDKDARQCRKNVPRKKVPALVLQKYKWYRRQIKNLKTQLRRTRKQTQNFKARLASAG